MWLPVDLVLAALLSSAFELAWVAERGGLSADGDPSDLDTDSSYVPALAPSPAPAFSPGGELWRELAQARTAPRIPVRVALAVGAVVVLTVAAIGGWLLLRPSGHTAPTAGPAPATAQGDPVPGPNQARLMRMLPSGYSPGSCEPATTPPRALAKIVCTHSGDPAGPTAATYTLVAEKASLRPLFDDLPRGSTIVTCPGTFSRPDPGAATPRPSKSAARWCAAIATASRRSPGPPRPTCSSATSMPIELGRRSTSSTNGGRRTPDALRPGPPRRLPAPTRRTPRRRRDPQTRSPRVRVSARRGCAVWRDHDDESAHHSTVCDTGALHRGDVGRPVALRLPQRRGVAGEGG